MSTTSGGEDNKNESLDLLDSILTKFKKVPQHLLSVTMLNDEKFIPFFLNNPLKLSVKETAAIFDLLAEIFSDATFPETTRRLLKIVVISDFLPNRIDLLIVEQYSDLLHNLSKEEVDKFLFNSFTILKIAFHQLETVSYKRLFSSMDNIEACISRNELSFSTDVHSIFESVVHLKNDLTYHHHQALKKSPSNFRDISICPTITELSSPSSNESFLSKNKTVGRYFDEDQYLEVHFRLMLEDFVAPLRAGVQEYLQLHPSEFKENIPCLESIRIYPNTNIWYPICTSEGIAHVMRFSLDFLSDVQWESGTRLKAGYFVMLSADKFKNIFFGTIINTDPPEKCQGIVTIKFHNEIPPANQNYVMLETEYYFEASRYVLEELQRIKQENFPMKRYLIDCKTDVVRPVYHNDKHLSFDLSSLVNDEAIKNNSTYQVPVTAAMIWPDVSDLVVDENQYFAIQTALTKELVIIQGPPGTGKTFVAVKTVEILLKSMAEIGPIFVVSHTNNALDNILESIYDLFKDKPIVRLGGQCKSKRLVHYTLNLLRKKKFPTTEFSRQISQSDSAVTQELEKKRETLRQHWVQQLISKSLIHTVASLKGIIDIQHADQLNSVNFGYIRDKDVLYNWLLNDDCRFHADDMPTTEIRRDELLIVNENNSQLLPSESSDLTEVDDVPSWLFSSEIRIIDEEKKMFHETFRHSSEKYHVPDINTLTGRNIQKYIEGQLRLDDRMTHDEVADVKDLWNIPSKQRWHLYRYWVHQYDKRLELLTKTAMIEFNNLLKERSELSKMKDLEIMRGAKVIGMTTAGASRYSQLLSKLDPRVTIVEEAAEVLESHLTVALSSGCQHVILIGDHQQLKPTTNVYRLAKNFMLDVSLFERLIKNKFEYVTLNWQRRMHPNIATILGFIYPDLKNHESVLAYPSVRGVAERITFMRHNQPEESSEGEIHSYRNTFEANFCVALCHHFLCNGYLKKQITILTLYKYQVECFQTLMSKSKHLYTGVNCCTVDNFQGEENDLVILSLVRSNVLDKIGFSGDENRICVALSRARYGLFVVGNFQLLISNSEAWSTVVKQFIPRDCLLPQGVTLQCQTHLEETVGIAKNADDFDHYAPEGGCNKMCDFFLKCGHPCNRYCHPYDPDHKKYKCPKLVEETCMRGHQCQRECWKQCPLCTVLPGSKMSTQVADSDAEQCCTSAEQSPLLESIAFKIVVVNFDRTCPIKPIVNILEQIEKAENTIGFNIVPYDDLDSRYKMRETNKIRSEGPVGLAVFTLGSTESLDNINSNRNGNNFNYDCYSTLKEISGDKVIIIVNNDLEYTEQEDSHISQFTRDKIGNQFDERRISGPDGLVVSWEEGPEPKHVLRFHNFVKQCISKWKEGNNG